MTAPALVFVTARWCDPGVPMKVIFDELVRDLQRIIPGLRSLVVDIDEAEGILASRADDAASGRAPDETLELDSLIDQAFAESIDFLPTIILFGEGDRLEIGESAPSTAVATGTAGRPVELARYVGQLPKLHIRAGILMALGLD